MYVFCLFFVRNDIFTKQKYLIYRVFIADLTWNTSYIFYDNTKIFVPDPNVRCARILLNGYYYAGSVNGCACECTACGVIMCPP